MIYGLVLAGGRSSRFGREKAVEPFAGEPMIGWVARALEQDCARLAVNAPIPSGAARFAEEHGWPCLADAEGQLLGPLAGVLTGLRWAQVEGANGLATSPCDTPLIPPNLIARLATEGGPAGAVARTADGLQPLCALWPVSALSVLEALHGHTAIRDVLEGLRVTEVVFADAAAFANLNTPLDFTAAEQTLEKYENAARIIRTATISDDAKQQ